MMGGMDWQAIEPVCAMLGVEDVDMMILRLLEIRNHGWSGD
jgi:hypothetical protein